MDNRDILTAAIKTYGRTMQEDVCVEEMAELAKAIIKFRRARPSEWIHCIKNIREEMADVQIMLDQMKMIYGETADIEQYKIDRLARRMAVKK